MKPTIDGTPARAAACAAAAMRSASSAVLSKLSIRRLPSCGSRWMSSSDSRCLTDAGPRLRGVAFLAL
ncbi:hypothetical protein [Streptomyces sp. SID13726]|uniref:hypothetical protein n=1 Tax=Streptomyces sp. SID13726 TaxID=2706058 RepID=UPI0013BD2842|nr:hypothetical protein [Streptomyces sp. SID13726]NEB02731.1 hypothetical protein [Streptomyces sp. SID13726]